jgi:alcohol dehydrogenase (cytochrome c)
MTRRMAPGMRLTLAIALLAGCWLARAEDLPRESNSSVVDVLPSELARRPPGANWLSYNGDFSGRRYSGLAEIKAANVGQLRAQWVFHSPNSNRLEVTPLVAAGVMFVTSANDTYALDAGTGRVIWRHAWLISPGLIDDASGHISRGVALWHSRLYRLTDNAHLLCLDARSGHLLWDVAYADWNRNYGATGAPLVANDKVIVGTSGGDDGVRGFVAAYDAATGKLAWRFWTVPAPGEFGSESWPGDLYLHGGGTTWMPGTYDPGTRTLFWGTSNPAPDFDGSVRPGDNLYTDCVLALDADTGRLKWYFQFTPHDLFDYDALETPILIDTVYRKAPHKLLVQANRNGFLYVLDRTNGKFISATPFVDRLTWAKGIDAQGRPIPSGLAPSPEGTTICPGYGGATNWFAPSYSESSHLVYFLALDECQTYQLKPQNFEEGKTFYSTGVKRIPGDAAQKTLLAYDLDKQSFAWRYPQVGTGHSEGGTMTTAGGLVFFGDDAQSLEALDAGSGKPLWHFNTGQDFSASPMSYAVRGRQYVAVAAGSNIFSFALP